MEAELAAVMIQGRHRVRHAAYAALREARRQRDMHAAALASMQTRVEDSRSMGAALRIQLAQRLRRQKVRTAHHVWEARAGSSAPQLLTSSHPHILRSSPVSSLARL